MHTYTVNILFLKSTLIGGKGESSRVKCETTWYTITRQCWHGQQNVAVECSENWKYCRVATGMVTARAQFRSRPLLGRLRHQVVFPVAVSGSRGHSFQIYLELFNKCLKYLLTRVYIVSIFYFFSIVCLEIFSKKMFLPLNFRIIKLKFKLEPEPGQSDGSGCSQIPRLVVAPAPKPRAHARA